MIPAADLPIIAIKLLFGVIAFLAIGYTTQLPNRRLPGVLLTFPVLNGIGLLTATGKDPAVMANSMYPMMAINAFLFLAFIALLVRVGHGLAASAGPIAFKLSMLAAYGGLWFLGALLIAPILLDVLPNGGWFFAIYIAAAAWPAWKFWSAQDASGAAVLASSPARDGGAGPASWRAFRDYCRERHEPTAVFALTLLLLLLAPYWFASEWVGKLSALPLPGAFVLAGIAVERPAALRPIRDTVLIGPLVAMAFVWTYTIVIVQLRPETGARYWIAGGVSLLLGWLVAMLAVLAALPALEAVLDARKARKS